MGNETKKTEKPAPAAGEAKLPKIDFSTFILSLSTTALYQMGLTPESPGGQRPEPDLLIARQTIDTLEMLRSKTRGNLDEEEANLFDSLIYELRRHFVDVGRRR